VIIGTRRGQLTRRRCSRTRFATHHLALDRDLAVSYGPRRSTLACAATVGATLRARADSMDLLLKSKACSRSAHWEICLRGLWRSPPFHQHADDGKGVNRPTSLRRLSRAVMRGAVRRQPAADRPRSEQECLAVKGRHDPSETGSASRADARAGGAPCHLVPRAGQT
jgi:hypothetical protein